MNKLYILKPNPKRKGIGNKKLDPWKPWYDKTFSAVICAKSSEAAREIADRMHGDETVKELNAYYISSAHWLRRPWLDPKMSTCIELKPTIKEKVIIRNFSAA